MPHGAAEEALKLISGCLIHIPHWPQLPQRSSKEGFVSQYLHPMLEADLLSLEQGKVFFRDGEPKWESKLMGYYEKVLKAEETGSGGEAFAFPQEAAQGFYAFLKKAPLHEDTLMVKGQVSGPVSMGLQITDSRGNPSFYSEQLREVTVKTLALHARWQAEQLQQLGLPALLFIDDPGIYSYGTSGYVGLDKKDIQESLKEIAGAIKGAGACAGVHSCAGVDWSIPLELPLEVVDFDAYDYFTSMLVYSEALSSFLSGGGILAWGIVPTSPEIESEDYASLLSLLEERLNLLASRGISPAILRKQLMVTPSCGAGTLTIEQAEKVYGELYRIEKNLDRIL